MSDTPGFVLWLTGEPAAGKTTLARALRQQLLAEGIPSVIIDSDELRAVLTPTPTYAESEREWVYGVIGHLARWLSGSGINVLIAATGNRQRYRDDLRHNVTRFAEVHVRSDEATRRNRDWKGLYTQVDSGQIDNVPGIDGIYEPPLAPEATVDTARLAPDEAADSVVAQLRAQRFRFPPDE